MNMTHLPPAKFTQFDRIDRDCAFTPNESERPISTELINVVGERWLCVHLFVELAPTSPHSISILSLN